MIPGTYSSWIPYGKGMEKVWKRYGIHVEKPWNPSTIPWNPSPHSMESIHHSMESIPPFHGIHPPFHGIHLEFLQSIPPSMDSTWNNPGRVKYCRPLILVDLETWVKVSRILWPLPTTSERLTYSSQWPQIHTGLKSNVSEIECELLPGQTAYDCPDLVAWVFQMKKKVVIDYIYKHGVFGSAVTYVYTIEFQKCRLPHMHILIFLKGALQTADPWSNRLLHLGAMARPRDPATLIWNSQEMNGSWPLQSAES